MCYSVLKKPLIRMVGCGPSRVRVDPRVENVLVRDAMVVYRSDGVALLRVSLFLLSRLCHGANWLFRSEKSGSYVYAAYLSIQPASTLH